MYKKRLIALFLVITVAAFLPITEMQAEQPQPYASLVFVLTSVSVGSAMDVEFDAAMKRYCESIYVSSCTLQRQNANGMWVYDSKLTPPSTKESNACDFWASAEYSSKCTHGNTYRIVATFKAIYNNATYTTTSTSNQVSY